MEGTEIKHGTEENGRVGRGEGRIEEERRSV